MQKKNNLILWKAFQAIINTESTNQLVRFLRRWAAETRKESVNVRKGT